jgi:hypothetical protein
MIETNRLQFLEQRDGVAATTRWALRTIGLYRAALKTPYGKAYRRSLILSCLHFRQYARS